uniref:MTOR-associated protein MEAK7 n=1 Tax=Strigamia maritima TaxID=126957 RepID=T1J516_STRMM
MGGKGSKSNSSTQSLQLSSSEQEILKRTFAEINENRPFRLEHWQKYLGTNLPVNFVRGFYHLLCGQAEMKADLPVGYPAFMATMVRILKQPPTELPEVFVVLASGGKRTVNSTKVYTLVGTLINSYTTSIANTSEYRSWNGKLEYIFDEALVCYIINDLVNPGAKKNEVISNPIPDINFDEVDISGWLAKTPLMTYLWSAIFYHHFPIADVDSGFPICANEEPIKSTMFNASLVFILNQCLPYEAKREWFQLYNSSTDGESFSVMLNKILDKGPTLILIKEKTGHIFGGFASQSWQINPSFRGTSESFLFSVKPKFNLYDATGYNNHFMYLNQNQQTLPNGLGFGGQLDYFGVWLNADFGTGKCSPTCITFNCPQLSAAQEFEISAVEVWRVGSEPKDEAEGMRDDGSILDGNPEAAHLLEMMGHKQVSKGLRDKNEKNRAK